MLNLYLLFVSLILKIVTLKQPKDMDRRVIESSDKIKSEISILFEIVDGEFWMSPKSEGNILPVELWCEILSSFTLLELFLVSGTCKSFCDVLSRRSRVINFEKSPWKLIRASSGVPRYLLYLFVKFGREIRYLPRSLWPYLSKIRINTLYFKDGNLGDEGVRNLLNYLKGSCLNSINLTGNQIGSRDATALSETLPFISCVNLNLGWNSLDKQGVVELARTVNGDLKFIKLRYNRATHEDVVAAGFNKDIKIAL